MKFLIVLYSPNGSLSSSKWWPAPEMGSASLSRGRERPRAVETASRNATVSARRRRESVVRTVANRRCVLRAARLCLKKALTCSTVRTVPLLITPVMKVKSSAMSASVAGVFGLPRRHPHTTARRGGGNRGEQQGEE